MLFKLHPLLLRRLRSVLQLVIPTAVAADTARSIVVTYNLAQERFKEWEEEDKQEMHREVQGMLEGVLRRCAAKDRDFWPAGLTLETAATSGGGDGITAPSTTVATQGSATSSSQLAKGGDVWQLMGLAGSTPAGTQPAVEQEERQQDQAAARRSAAAATARAWAEQEEQQLLHHQQQREEHAQQAQRQQQRGAVVVITLHEALTHVASNVASLELPWSTLMAPPAGVVHVTVSDVVSILGSTPPAKAAASKKQQLERGIIAVADATRDSLRDSLPWPQMQLSRKSALRYDIDWRGVHWPAPPAQPLERDLSCC